MQIHAILDGSGQVISIGKAFIDPKQHTGSYLPQRIEDITSLASEAKFIRTNDGQQFGLMKEICFEISLLRIRIAEDLNAFLETACAIKQRLAFQLL